MNDDRNDNNRPARKFSIKKESLRRLSRTQLSTVAGGYKTSFDDCICSYSFWEDETCQDYTRDR